MNFLLVIALALVAILAAFCWYTLGIEITFDMGHLWAKEPRRWSGRFYLIVSKVVEITDPTTGKTRTLEDTEVKDL
jgi:hypothetical protein